MLYLRFAEARTLWPNPMSVVEPHQSLAVGPVQSQGVAQSVWPLRRRFYPLDLELEPVALFKVMNTAIESQQELECMLIGYGTLQWLSCDDSIILAAVKLPAPQKPAGQLGYTSTGFGSTIFAATMEISYSAISGKARPVCVMISGGARIAATTNMPTQA